MLIIQCREPTVEVVPIRTGFGHYCRSNTVCGSLTPNLRDIIHPFVQSTVLIHSANVVSGSWNVCFNVGISIA